MRLATSEDAIGLPADNQPGRLRRALEQGIRPAVGFQSPDDVVKDPHLTGDQKREILASWASDASALKDEPGMRWLLGTVEPVKLDDVRDAMRRLDLREGVTSSSLN